MKNKLYVINGKTYLSHINDEVHLYGLLHQLAFLAGRIKDEEDVFHVLDTAKRYGEIAEEKFQSWGIPGSGFRMLVGDIYNLIVLYHSLARCLSEAETEKDFLRLKKRAGNYEKEMKRIYRSLGLPVGSGVAHDTLEEAIIKRHNLIPLEEVEDDPQDDGLEGDEVWSD